MTTAHVHRIHLPLPPNPLARFAHLRHLDWWPVALAMCTGILALGIAGLAFTTLTTGDVPSKQLQPVPTNNQPDPHTP